MESALYYYSAAEALQVLCYGFCLWRKHNADSFSFFIEDEEKLSAYIPNTTDITIQRTDCVVDMPSLITPLLHTKKRSLIFSKYAFK
jgi:hypothetical protein